MTKVLLRSLLIAVVVTLLVSPFLGGTDVAFEYCKEIDYDAQECKELREAKDSGAYDLVDFIGYVSIFLLSFLSSSLAGLWGHFARRDKMPNKAFSSTPKDSAN